MHVGRIILLVAEDAVQHADEALAVDEMRGIGRDADHPVGTGRRLHIQTQQFDILRTLGDHAHPAAVVDPYILQGHVLAVEQGKGGIVARCRAEGQDVADRRLPEILAVQAVAARPDLLRRISVGPDPVIVDMVGHFLAHGIELQQAGEGINLPVGLPETERALQQVDVVMLREFHFEEALAHGCDPPFGYEGAGEIDGQVPHLDPAAALQVEGRDMTGKEEHGPVPLDGEVLPVLQLEGDALHRRVVVADILILLEGAGRFDAERVAGQDQG